MGEWIFPCLSSRSVHRHVVWIGIESRCVVLHIEIVEPIQIMKHEAGSKPYRAPILQVLVDPESVVLEFPLTLVELAVVIKIVNTDLESVLCQLFAQFTRDAVL